MNKKALIFLVFTVFFGQSMYAFSKSAGSLLKVSAKLRPLQQPEADPVRQEIVKQFEVADLIEKDIAQSKEAQKLEELNHVMGVTYSLLGLNFDFLGERTFALFFYEKAYSLNPNNLERILDYATELGQHYRYDESKALFEKAQNSGELLPFHHSAYGYVLYQMKDYSAAKAQYAQTMQMNPMSRDANYAMLMTVLCESASSNTVVKPSKVTLSAFDLSIWPGQILSYLAGTMSERQLKKYIQAQSPLDAQKKLSELFYYVGELQLSANKPKKAHKLFSEVVSLKINSYRETEASKQRLLQLTETVSN